VLDLSKIEAGRLQLETTDFSLDALLGDVRSMIAEQARAKGLAIEVAPSATAPRAPAAAFSGDTSRFRRLLSLFEAGHGGDGQRMLARLADGDRDGAAQLSHTLKGVAGNIGATELADCAARLDGGLRTGMELTGCIALARDCDEALRRLLLMIDMPADESMVRAALADRYAAFSQQIDAFDYAGALDILRKLALFRVA